MTSNYPVYKYDNNDAAQHLAHYVRLDNPNSYPFDNFHAHEYNEIMIFIKGGGKHNINFKTHTIEDNAIHLVAADDIHWVERSMQSTGFAIVYKDQFLQKLQLVNPSFDYAAIFDHSRILNLNESEIKAFEFIFNEMLNNNAATAYMLQVIGTFMTKVAYLNHGEPVAKKIFDPVVNDVVKLINKHFKTEKKIEYYAAQLYLTSRTLQNRFKKASSITINELLQQRILKEAKKLLCTTQMSVADIAIDLGFKETAHFSNWFFKHASCYPLEYKYEND